MKLSFFPKACFAFFLLILLSESCKKEKDLNNPDPNPIPDPVVVNDAIQVTANVSGIVLDEANLPVEGASVTSGTASAITDAYGSFSFRNITLSKENGSVKVVKAGYFKAVRTFKTTAAKDHLLKIQLMEKQLSGSIAASAGGTILSNGNASITFPAAAFVTASGTAFTGTVNVYSRWIDPTSANLPFIIPGDLRGVATDGSEHILQTYGMVGTELEDAAGNPLKLAPGKTADMIFPIPAVLMNTAPDSIILWHFDDATSRWKQEGVARRSGSSYAAKADKFSFWNCDVGLNNLVQLDYTLVNNATNAPLVGVFTRLRAASSNSYVYGITNNTGFVSGLVLKNVPLIMEVLPGGCSSEIYSQALGPFSGNTSLGNIMINLPASRYINFKGTVVDCMDEPVTYGHISLYSSGGNFASAPTDSLGNFSFSILNCTSSPLIYSYRVTNDSTGTQSGIFTGTATSPVVELDTIAACSTQVATNIYVAGSNYAGIPGQYAATVWKDGVATILTNVADHGYAKSVFVSGGDVYVSGTEKVVSTGIQYARVWKNGTLLYTLNSGPQNVEANSVVVSSGDVYVAGTVGNVGMVWKNGIGTTLPNPSGTATNVNPYAIAVDGSDVYVAGSISNGLISQKAVLWKNGVVMLYITVNNSEFTSVFISGTDIYTAGWQSNPSQQLNAKFWKNGVATILDNGATGSRANGIFVSGTDIYVIGSVDHPTSTATNALLWKNGTANQLNSAGSWGNAYGVTMKGNDVYVTGIEYITGIKVKVWKNFFPIDITNGINSASAHGIFVQ